MYRLLLGVVAALMLVHPVAAELLPFPATFRTQDIDANGVTLHVRTGGEGPVVVLIHGFGDTGDMWAPLAADLVRDHRVIVPDLRGMGLSSHPQESYDKRTQAGDIRTILTSLGIDQATIVGHDIGTMVAYAYAVRYPDKTQKLVVMDAPVPGIPPWETIVRNPLLWHFDFGGPDVERLVRVGSGSISTGSGTSSRAIQRRSTRKRASITLASMPALVRCIRRLPSFAPSGRMLRTTRFR